MSNYRHGTYFKGTGDKRVKLEINDSTPEKDVEDFLKGLDAGTTARIKSGVSEAVLQEKARLAKKAKAEKATK